MFYMQRTILVVSVVLPMVAALAVAARFQARRIKNLPIKADEWLIVVALVRSSILIEKHLHFG